MGTAAGFRQRGVASYYGEGFHGNLTANGETFDMYALTCAHLTLPFNTILRVHNLDNDREVTVRVNDRGPYVGGRIIDLSKGAAEDLGMLEAGTANVLLMVIN
jgi:rare lipoprotein A